MADKDRRPSSQHMEQSASYGGIAMDTKTAKQLSSSGTTARRKRDTNKKMAQQGSSGGGGGAESSASADKGAQPSK